MLTKKLEELNISKNEAKIYLSLLELCEANMARLCDKSGVKRSTAYEAIESLKKKGLVSVTRKNKKLFYYAENPSKIGEMIDETKHSFDAILPQLLSLTNTLDKKPNIRFFEGIKGVMEVYRDVLRHPGTELLFWTSQEEWDFFRDNADMMKKYVSDNFTKQRIEKKINARMIMPVNESTKKLKEEEKNNLRQVRLIPPGTYKTSVVIALYGKDSIAIVSYQKSEEMAIIIQSSKIKKTLKNIFEMCWDLLSQAAKK